MIVGPAAGEKTKSPVSKAEADRNVQKIPTKIAGTYKGGELVELRVRGRIAFLLEPTGKIDPRKRWLWDFPFWLAIDDGFGNVTHRHYVEKALAAGFHIAGTAAGCQFVAACDLAVASESATFATPGVEIGLFCTTPAVPLVRAVPAKAAMEMLLTGRTISAAQTLAWGLVNRVVRDEELDEVVAELAGPTVASSPMTVRLGKAAFYGQMALLDERQAYELASEVMTRTMPAAPTPRRAWRHSWRSERRS